MIRIGRQAGVRGGPGMRWMGLLALALVCGAWSVGEPRRAVIPESERAPLPIVAIVRAADWMGHEWSEDALRVGLQEADMEEGRDYQLRVTSAQGNLTALPALIDAAVDAHVAVLVTLQDATLEVAVRRAKGIPIVFHLLSDPFAAGAGTSDSNHLANVTGVYSPGFGDPEQSRRVDLILKIVPQARRVGILFTPEEALSVVFKDRMATAASKAGMAVSAVPVSSSTEAATATRSLCGLQVDAIELYGNQAHAGFAGVIKVARECRIPVFSPSPFEVMQGATAALFPDFQDGGAVAGRMVARVLRGESPAKIPFYRVTTTKLAVNPAGASSTGATVPETVLHQADTVVTGKQAPKPR